MLAASLESAALFPLTLTFSPKEREPLSTAWDYAVGSEHFPTLPIVLPRPKGEGRGEGELALLQPKQPDPCSNGQTLQVLQ
jgi:hypothetical protein